MKPACKVFLLFLFFSVNSWASDAWYTLNADKKATLNVELFLLSTCPHCDKEDTFFTSIAAQHPELHISRNFINQDKKALFRFNQLLSEQHMDDFSVPSIYFCGSRWLGFASDKTTGKVLLHALAYCKQQIEKDGFLTSATINTLRHWANANKFDSGMVQHPSALRYIVTIALLDAFTPCSFFCFAGFLAFLFVEKRGKKQFVAGILFIIALFITHYFQQVQASLYYQILPWLRVPSAILGFVTTYFVVQNFRKQSNDIMYFSLAFLLGLMASAYQQTCIMNWAYIFEQWLDNQHLSALQTSFYQVLYQIIYVLPLLITLLFYLTLLKMERFAGWQPYLLNIGLLYILAIALCLIAYPMLLTYLTLSVITVIILFICGRFLKLT